MKNLECQNHIIIIITTFSNMFLTILKIISAIGIFLISHGFQMADTSEEGHFPSEKNVGIVAPANWGIVKQQSMAISGT